MRWMHAFWLPWSSSLAAFLGLYLLFSRGTAYAGEISVQKEECTGVYLAEDGTSHPLTISLLTGGPFDKKTVGYLYAEGSFARVVLFEPLGSEKMRGFGDGIFVRMDDKTDGDWSSVPLERRAEAVLDLGSGGFKQSQKISVECRR